jgi:NAD(P)-dependent dehydrogenase (short-subunit alcohol dehydrogenase family)
VDLQLAGARAVVAGGSRGIGRAVARGLLAEGARVAIVARHGERLRAAAAELGPEVLAVPADTTDDAAVRAMVEQVVGAWAASTCSSTRRPSPRADPCPRWPT